MGLFQHRPEEPTEWGGLPAEPWEPKTIVDRLDTQPGVSLPLLAGADAGATIEISVDLGTAIDLSATTDPDSTRTAVDGEDDDPQ